MKKILSLILGLLWALPAFADLDPCRNLLNTPERLEISKWYKSTGTIVSTDPDTRTFAMFTIQIIKSDINAPAPSGCGRNFYGPVNNFKCTFTTPENTTYCRFYNNGERINSGTSIFPCEPNTQYTFSMDVISANPTIRNGIIYSHMQLEKGATATEFTPACTGINVATTKYTNKQFEPLDLMLSNAISVVDSVVTQTITQAASIATLQAQKQTRPNDIADDNEKCPAGKKCLLVEDASGIPHWYEIVENAWDLPVGYTQLEYIESTGTQWINTGVTPAQLSRNSTEIFIDGQYTGLYAANFAALFGTQGSSVWFKSDIKNNTSIGVQMGEPNTETVVNVGNALSRVKININTQNNLCYVNNSSYALHISNSAFSLSGQITLFKSNGVANDQYAKAKIYSMYIKNNGAHVRNFIPVKQNSDGAIGMYDLVGGRFYENAGTGDFIAGPVVQ